jgi:hypothetical protein
MAPQVSEKRQLTAVRAELAAPPPASQLQRAMEKADGNGDDGADQDKQADADQKVR